MTKKVPRAPERALLLRLIDESYDKTAWHGPNLRGATRRVSATEAVWRPKPGRHNIAEIVVHCAYWKYAVRRRIVGGKRGAFPLKGSNWFEVTALTGARWRAYLDLLDQCHADLRETVATATPATLADKGGPKAGSAAHVFGIALHDTYHAGQIRTLKSLYKSSRPRRS